MIGRVIFANHGGGLAALVKSEDNPIDPTQTYTIVTDDTNYPGAIMLVPVGASAVRQMENANDEIPDPTPDLPKAGNWGRSYDYLSCQKGIFMTREELQRNQQEG